MDALVDTETYPVGRAGKGYDSLVSRCRADLDHNGLCMLPGFLKASVATAMAAEVTQIDGAKRWSTLRTPYLGEDNSMYASGHPRSALFPQRFNYLISSDVPAGVLVRQLFQRDELTQFVSDVLGTAPLYRSECPTLSLQVNIMNEGDVFPWHFDQTDGAVTLLLQQPDGGGRFQYAPNVRGSDAAPGEREENYEAIADIFDGVSERVLEPSGQEPGALMLFRGRHSLHQVSQVGSTSKPRVIVIFSYESQPGSQFPASVQAAYRNPTSAVLCGRVPGPRQAVWRPHGVRNAEVPPLHSGVALMPKIGYGVGTAWLRSVGSEREAALEGAIVEALRAGFRHVDDAELYGNERATGAAIARWVREGGGARSELYVTQKVIKIDEGVVEACRRSLEAMGLAYFDLYLLHAPCAYSGEPLRDGLLAAWEQMERLVDEGLSRAIGVSNFQIADLEEIYEAARHKPACNQVEAHPYLQQPALGAWCAARGIALTVYAPQASLTKPELRGGPVDAVVEAEAARLGASPSQLLLAWALHAGAHAVITTTSKAERMAESLRAADLPLPPTCVEAIRCAGRQAPRRTYWLQRKARFYQDPTQEPENAPAALAETPGRSARIPSSLKDSSLKRRRASGWSLAVLVDLARYPIDRPGSDAYEALVRRCRHELTEHGLLSLPHFLHQAAVRRLIDEVEQCMPRATRFDWTRTPYSWLDNSGFVMPHPRAWRHQESHLSLSTDQLDAEGGLSCLYAQDALTDFLRDCQVHTGVWACGHVGVWACGHVGMWACGRVGMWACGHVGMWAWGIVHGAWGVGHVPSACLQLASLAASCASGRGTRPSIAARIQRWR